jgi:hypothetical protein
LHKLGLSARPSGTLTRNRTRSGSEPRCIKEQVKAVACPRNHHERTHLGPAAWPGLNYFGANVVSVGNPLKFAKRPPDIFVLAKSYLRG